MNLQDRSVLVVDHGIFVPLAERLAGQFGKVGYFAPWETTFNDGRELVIGSGLDGIERVKYFEKEYRDYDLLVFPHVHDGWLVKDLRDRGFRVWGSGPASELELLRWKTKERFKELGLPVNDSHRVNGVTELRKFLQENESTWYVKVSLLRGLGETWCSENYAQSKNFIDDFEAKNGPLAHMVHFIIEAPIPDANEIGYDGLSVDGQFPSTSMYGWEIKDSAFLATTVDYNDLPEPLRKTNELLSPFLKEQQYRNYFAAEFRNDICIDICCRHASPGGEILDSNIENLGEVLWEGSGGVLVQPEFKHKYGAQIVLTSEWAAREHPQLVHFPDDIRPWVSLYNHCRANDGTGIADWVIPQFVPHFDRMKQIGSVVALADDPQEAIDLCKERAEQIKGFKVTCDCDALDKAYEEMASSGQSA